MPNVVPNSFKVARSLGRSQRALRNQAYKDARGVSREFKNDYKTKGKTADPLKLIGRTDEIRSDFHKGREILRAEQKNLSRPQRVVSNMYQYPARYAAGTTATAGAAGTAGGVQYKRKQPVAPVKKNVTGPFGVEITKSSYKETSRDPEFRRSVVHGANPRSETFVRRGTAPERYAVTLGGGTLGAAVVPVVGGGVGGTYGRRRNLKKDRVRAYRKSDKAKAQKWTGVSPDIGMYSYGKEPVKKGASAEAYKAVERIERQGATQAKNAKQIRDSLWNSKTGKYDRNRAKYPIGMGPHPPRGPIGKSMGKSAFGVDHYTEIEKGIKQKIAATGLAGMMAVGGGLGAVKAAPAIQHAGGNVVDTVRFAGSGNSQFNSARVAHLKNLARKTGKPQTMATYSKEGWKQAGRPGGSNWWHGSDTGTHVFSPNGERTFIRKSDTGPFGIEVIEKKRKRLSDWSSEHAKEQAAQRANIPPQRGDVPSKEVALRSPSTVSTRSAGNVANRGSSTVSRSAAGTTDEGVAGKARRGSRLKDMFRGAQHAARMNLGPAVGSDNPILAMARAQKPTAPSGASGGVKATVENVTPNNAGGTARGPGGGSLSSGGGNPFAIEGGPRGGSAPPPGGARPGASHAGPTSAPGAAPSGSAGGASAFPAGAFGGAKPAGGNTAPNAGHAPQSSPPPAQAAAQAAKKFKFTAKGGGKAALATGVIGGAGALGFGAGKKEWS